MMASHPSDLQGTSQVAAPDDEVRSTRPAVQVIASAAAFIPKDVVQMGMNAGFLHRGVKTVTW